MMKLIPTAITLLAAVQLTHAADEPKELARLRESYQQAQERALAPLQAKYVSSLEAMKLRLTKAGKLEEALAVDAEIKAVTAKAEEQKPETAKAGNDPENLIGQWYCNGVEADVYVIEKDNKASHFRDKGVEI